MLQDHLQYHLYYSINTSLNIDSDDKKDPGEILNYILQKKGREDNNDKLKKKKHKQKYHTCRYSSKAISQIHRMRQKSISLTHIYT